MVGFSSNRDKGLNSKGLDSGGDRNFTNIASMLILHRGEGALRMLDTRGQRKGLSNAYRPSALFPSSEWNTLIGAGFDNQQRLKFANIPGKGLCVYIEFLYFWLWAEPWWLNNLSSPSHLSQWWDWDINPSTNLWPTNCPARKMCWALMSQSLWESSVNDWSNLSRAHVWHCLDGQDPEVGWLRGLG